MKAILFTYTYSIYQWGSLPVYLYLLYYQWWSPSVYLYLLYYQWWSPSVYVRTTTKMDGCH